MSERTNSATPSAAADIDGAVPTPAQRQEMMAANPNSIPLTDSNLRGFSGIEAAIDAGVFISADNFGKDPVERFKLTSLATNGEEIRLDDCHGQVIEPSHWYVHTVEIANEANGEVEIVPRVVLLTAKRECYVGVSRGLFSSMRLIWQSFGDGPLPKGLKFRVNRKPTRSGFKTLLLEAVFDDTKSPSARKS